jgi:hypothetical protein
MSESGHFRQIDPLPTFSACPLRSDRVRTFAPQRIDAVCQCTKSLRDSLLPDGLRIIPRVEMVGSGGSALS